MFRLARKVAHSYSLSKTAAALRTLLGSRRKKKAYTPQEIDRLVHDALRREGVPQRLREQGAEVPNLPWGRILTSAIYALSARRSWDDQMREEFLIDVVGDLIMGRDVSGAASPWKHNLATQVEEWVLDGWDEDRIGASLTRWAQSKAKNLLYRWHRNERPQDLGLSPGTRQENSGASEIFESLLTPESLTSSGIAEYHSLLRDNPEARQVIDLIERSMSQKDGTQALVWQAFVRDPGASLRVLLETPVQAPGAFVEEPLVDALGWDRDSKSNPGKLQYQLKKIREELLSKWPVIKDILQEI